MLYKPDSLYKAVGDSSVTGQIFHMVSQNNSLIYFSLLLLLKVWL